MAGGDGDKAGSDGDNGANEDDKKHEKEVATTADGADDNAGDRATTNNGSKKGGHGEIRDRFGGFAGGDDVFLNSGEEATEAVADDIADVDGERTDDETEVDKEDGDDEAREDALDAVIVDAEAGELRIDDDEEEDDEDDVSDVAGVLPDDVNRGGVVHRDGRDFEHVADSGIEGVDSVCDNAAAGADEPRERAGLFLTGVVGVVGSRSFVGLLGGFGIFGFVGIFGRVSVSGIVGSVRVVRAGSSLFVGAIHDGIVVGDDRRRCINGGGRRSEVIEKKGSTKKEAEDEQKSGRNSGN